MPARESVPAKDHTGESLFGHATVAPELDGAAARVYRNRGNGLSEVSGKNYNEAHGRVASAPTVGGTDIHEKRSPRGKPAGAPTSKRVSAEFLG